jgi:leucyl-tRNA synthetase
LTTTPASTSSSTQATSTKSVFSQAWPAFDVEALKEDKIVCGIQINGKTRFNIEYEESDFPSDGDQATQEQFLKDLVYKHERANKWLKDENGQIKSVRKMIVAKGGKIVSFVV